MSGNASQLYMCCQTKYKDNGEEWAKIEKTELTFTAKTWQQM